MSTHVSSRQWLLEIIPAKNLRMRIVPHQKLVNMLLESMYKASLPAIRKKADPVDTIEVGHLRIAVPWCRKWIKSGLSGIQIDLTPEQASEYHLLALAVTSQLGMHKALAPIDEFLSLGGIIVSPFHRFFTRYGWNMDEVKQKVEELRVQKNLEFRELLLKQRSL